MRPARSRVEPPDSHDHCIRLMDDLLVALGGEVEDAEEGK